MDLRADRAAGAPTVRLEHAAARDGGDVITCFDDGAGADSVASDRLWLCRDNVSGTGPGRIVLVDGAGGASERVLQTVGVTLVPGRKLRWTWNARALAWPADQQGAQGLGALGYQALLAGSGLPDAPDVGMGIPGDAPGGQAGGEGAPGRPGGPGGLSKYFSLAITYQAPTRDAAIPSRLRFPEWPALVCVPFGIAAIVGARAAWQAFSTWRVRRRLA
ncbi:MAG: hypothetical protein V4850_10400 [Myxococcota bacterium]